MKKGNLLVAIILSLKLINQAYAIDCDCTSNIGTCSGAIEFIKGYGANKNFGAEIIVHSNELKCSKVEYFVDNTPYQNILKNTNSEQQSIFGTSPITEENIKYHRCSICKSASNNEGTNHKKNNDSNFNGTWNGSTRNFLGFKNNIVLHISQLDGNKYNVSYDFAGKNYPGIGTLNNNTLTASPSGGCNLTLTLNGDNKLNWFCAISGFTSKGIFTKID